MYPTDTPVEVAPKKSRRFLWVGIAVVAITLVVAVAVTIAVMNGSKKETVSQATPTPAAKPEVASNEEVKQSLAVLDATIKQAATDQATAKSALKDGSSQIKVSN